MINRGDLVMDNDIGEEFAMGLFALSVAFGLVWFAFAVVAHA
jgi:hypothetical protein